MRRALNENPMVQMAVLGMIGVAFAILLFTTVLKGKDTGAAVPPAGVADAAGAPVATDTASADVVPSVDSTLPTDPAAAGTDVAPTSPEAGSADGLLPTKGLPKDLLVAYAKGQAIALLVVDPKAQGSAKIEDYTRRLGESSNAQVFVVAVKNIADYSRITTGVAVSQAPALVVIRPRKLTANVPTATVSYGFRSPRSVAQALEDALYKGEPVSAYP